MNNYLNKTVKRSIEIYEIMEKNKRKRRWINEKKHIA